MIDVADFVGRFEGLRRGQGESWTARCPAHEDRANSLSVSVGDDGKILVKCHAGCPFESIIAQVHVEARELFPDNGRNGHGGNRAALAQRHGTIEALYDYNDAEGRLLFQVVRKVPKTFVQRHRCPKAQGGWSYNLGGPKSKCGCPRVEPVLYRLPELLEAIALGKTVLVVEGEKDVENARLLGLVATTSPMGAGKWRVSYAQGWSGARAVLVPDKDEPGKKHMREVAASLRSAGAEVRVLELPGTGKDLSDWIAAGGTAGALEKLMERAPVWTGAEERDERAAPLVDEDNPLSGLSIERLVRRVLVKHVEFDLTLLYRGRKSEVERLASAELGAYRKVRDRALESCMLLPLSGKGTSAAWQDILSEALSRVEEAKADPEEASAGAVQEELSRMLAGAQESEAEEALLDLRRGMAVRLEGRICVLPQLAIRRVRAALREDAPERGEIIDAARALGMSEYRPRIDKNDRPRVWAFPDPKGDPDATPADLFE